MRAPKGGSLSASGGATAAKRACSSAYQSDRKSHQQVEETQKSNPQSLSVSHSRGVSPGVQAMKRQSGRRAFAAATSFRVKPAGTDFGLSNRKPETPASSQPEI